MTLRSLTAPHLSQQNTIPPATSSASSPLFDPRAALAYTPHPASTGPLSASDNFVLAPVLTLPPAFGPAYVGETFSCTLVASNEPAVDASKSHPAETLVVQDVRVAAEMGTPGTAPGANIPLDMKSAPGAGTDERDAAADDAVRVVQKIVRHELLDEGTHVLAVTVTYNEIRRSGAGETLGNRVRTFRKLYQFAAKPLLSISTKVRRVPRRAAGEARGFVVEAQVENVAETGVVMDVVQLIGEEGVEVVGLNTWEGDAEAPSLGKGDVWQGCFVVKGVEAAENEEEEEEEEGGDVVWLGRLRVRWRNAMGERGGLLTGRLKWAR